MNFKRISFTGALLGASLCWAAGGMSVASASQDGAASNDRPDSLATQNGKNGWTCPMHPEIHAHESGKCPVCKMNLVKAKPKRD